MRALERMIPERNIRVESEVIAMAAEKIENCNSCDIAGKITEVAALVLAKFSEDLVDMAKENWCESHIIMLRRLVLAVQRGTRYDETLLPEEEAEQAFTEMEGGLNEV